MSRHTSHFSCIAALIIGLPHSVCAATPPSPKALSDKADYFEQKTDAMITPLGLLGTSGDSAIWTGMYVAAEANRFAATQDPDALRNMERSLRGLHALSEITQTPGLIARVIDDSPRTPGTSLPSNLHEGTGLYAGCAWEGGGSFDQYLGYLFGISEAWPYIQDQELKNLLREDVRQIGLNLIRNNGIIIGADTHLDSSPYYYYQDRWPAPLRLLGSMVYMLPARGGNAMSGLHIMKVASVISEDPRISDFYYHELIENRDYNWYVEYRSEAHADAFITNNAWWLQVPAKLFYGSDVQVTADSMRSSVGTNLAHVELYDLCRLETDPQIRQSYFNAFISLHKTVEHQSNTFWNFLAVAQLGIDKTAIAESLDSLGRFPLGDDDPKKLLQMPDVPKYKGLTANFFKDKVPTATYSMEPLPFEKRTMHPFAWQQNPFDMAGKPYSIANAGGSAYLVAYWIGRNHGFIPGPDGFTRPLNIAKPIPPATIESKPTILPNRGFRKF